MEGVVPEEKAGGKEWEEVEGGETIQSTSHEKRICFQLKGEKDLKLWPAKEKLKETPEVIGRGKNFLERTPIAQKIIVGTDKQDCMI